MRRLLPLLSLVLALPAVAESNLSISGKVGLEARYFPQDASFPGQHGSTALSGIIEPEFQWSDESQNNLFSFVPFLRLDQRDSERTHADIRELSWIHVGDDWELRSGIRTVFWGVTEFQHLVDIINQTDAVEAIDAEEKLGQPMVNLSLVKDWGIIDLFVLPGFRERTFPGVDGRFRGGLVVDTDLAEYESAAEEKHVDLALRWSHTFDVYDIGLYWFRGTSRDPQLRPVTRPSGETILSPFYPQITQYGLDLQATIESWLWKLEAIRRDSKSEEYWAAQAGFEYTLVGVSDSAVDLGLLMEYGWDERDDPGLTTFQNDLFVGTRITLNDAASTEFLAGAGYDLDTQSKSFLVEASRRFGDNWKVSLDAGIFSSDDPTDVAHSIRNDDYVKLQAEYFF